jgi:hypothetical protein
VSPELMVLFLQGYPRRLGDEQGNPKLPGTGREPLAGI